MPTLAFIGDVMLGRLVDQEIEIRPPDSFWGTALPVLRSADAVIANLECAISARGSPWNTPTKVFCFRARPAAVEVLRAGNIRVVSLANNHCLDYGDDALLDTLRCLDDAGIAHAGAGRCLKDAMAPAVLDVAGLRIAVIGVTDNEPPFAASEVRPGTYYSEVGAPALLPSLRRIADELRNDGVGFTVLSIHWGPNMVEVPPNRFRRFARAAIDSGIDLLHGHSAHLFQAVEAHSGGLILYDTGDFLDDYAVDPQLRNDWSFIFLVDVSARRPHRLRLVPVRLSVAQVDLATGAEAEAIMSVMRRRCAAIGVSMTEGRDGLELAPPARAPSSGMRQT